MSAAHLEQMFLAPRDFLKMNLLYLVGNLPTLKGSYNFSYEPAQGAHCHRKSMQVGNERYPLRVWYVRLVASGARGSVPAYFLPYRPGRLIRAMMPRSGQFMLAAIMAGCTFGAARYRSGGMEVCHGNDQTADGSDDTTRMARETAWCSSRLEDRSFRERIHGHAAPNGMPRTVLGATVIGVNNARQGWQLYAQQWEKLPGPIFGYHGLITL